MGRPPKEPKKTNEQEYLAQHPNSSPYDLLMAGVINQSRFDELSKAPEPVNMADKLQVQEEKPLEQQKVKPTIVITNPIIPKLSDLAIPQNKGRAYLKDKTTGKSTLMSRGSAEREKKKYPNRYEIL